MKIAELPEEQKYYSVELTNRNTYSITGLQKKAIMGSGSNFVELPSGEIVNKLHIVSISLNAEKTKDEYARAQERAKLTRGNLSIDRA